MIIIQLPTALRSFTNGQSDVEVKGTTVGEAVKNLTDQYPDLQRHLYGEDGKLRSFVNIYLNDEDIRSFDGAGTKINDGDTLMLIPAIAGG